MRGINSGIMNCIELATGLRSGVDIKKLSAIPGSIYCQQKRSAGLSGAPQLVKKDFFDKLAGERTDFARRDCAVKWFEYPCISGELAL